MYGTPTWISWNSMRRRVFDETYHNHHIYKDIKITPRWLDADRGFLNFVRDMGTRPTGTTLGRINDGDRYDKRHCAWQTAQEQMDTRMRKAAA